MVKRLISRIFDPGMGAGCIKKHVISGIQHPVSPIFDPGGKLLQIVGPVGIIGFRQHLPAVSENPNRSGGDGATASAQSLQQWQIYFINTRFGHSQFIPGTRSQYRMVTILALRQGWQQRQHQ